MAKTNISKYVNAIMLLAGFTILLYLFYHIGIVNILAALKVCDLSIFFIAIAVTLFTTALRVLKLKVLFSNLGRADILKIYLLSKIGKEAVFLGNFSPLMSKEFRNASVAQKLLLERYIEVLCTMIFGLIASVCLIFSFGGIRIYLLLFLCTILTMIISVATNISPILSKLKLPNLIINFVKDFRDAVWRPQFNEPLIAVVLISTIATIMDFAAAFLFFKALGFEIGFLFIPIVWAASGIVSFVTFMQVGTGDWSAVYLYSALAGVTSAGAAAMIVIHRFISLVNIAVVLVCRLLMSAHNRLREMSIILTEKCNSRCLNCRIWETPTSGKEDLDPSFVDKIPYRLGKITLTGGEPLLYNNLPEVIVKLSKKKPKRIVITSNGLSPALLERLLSAIKRMEPKTLKKLSFRFSYDALGGLNDTLRGIAGTEARLVASIGVVKGYGIKDVGVTQAGREENVKDISKVYDFASENGIQYGFQLVHSSKVYFNNEGEEEGRILSIREFRNSLNYIIVQDLKTLSPVRWFRAFFHSFYFRMALGDLKRPSMHPCRAGRSYVFVSPSGDIRPCIFFEKNYGNIFDRDSIADMIKDNSEIRDQVDGCSKNCWLICTANQEIKNNPILGMIWIVKSWMKIALARDVV